MKYSERIYKEIINEDAAIWFIEEINVLSVIIKAPSDTLKAILNDNKVQILLGKDNKTKKPVFHSGVRIFDDPINFISITCPHLFYRDNESLKKIILSDFCFIRLYNELNICVASSQIHLEKSHKTEALGLIGNPKDLYSGKLNKEVIASSNSFDFSLDNSRQFGNPYKIKILILDCHFSKWNYIETHLVGFNEQYKININELDEGAALEKQVWFSLENLFKLDVYKSPKFKSSKGYKELTDILAFHDLGIFLIEAKSLSVYSSADDKSMKKKVSTLKKHMKKAIKQLVGATKNINNKTEIFNSKEEIINLKNDIIPHCIVLVSELLPFGDWSDIEHQILLTISKENIYLNVMDFREFINIIKCSKGVKENFDFLLMKRTEGFIKIKNIHIRAK